MGLWLRHRFRNRTLDWGHSGRRRLRYRSCCRSGLRNQRSKRLSYIRDIPSLPYQGLLDCILCHARCELLLYIVEQLLVHHTKKKLSIAIVWHEFLHHIEPGGDYRTNDARETGLEPATSAVTG